MRYSVKIFFLSAAYAGVLTTGVASFCVFSIFKCQLGENVAPSEAVVPAAVIFGVLLMVGLFVGALVERANDALEVRGRFFFLKALSVGAVLGVLPRLLWEAATGSFPETYYPHVDYLPFLAAGIVVAALSALFGRRR